MRPGVARGSDRPTRRPNTKGCNRPQKSGDNNMEPEKPKNNHLGFFICFLKEEKEAKVGSEQSRVLGKDPSGQRRKRRKHGRVPAHLMMEFEVVTKAAHLFVVVTNHLPRPRVPWLNKVKPLIDGLEPMSPPQLRRLITVGKVTLVNLGIFFNVATRAIVGRTTVAIPLSIDQPAFPKQRNIVEANAWLGHSKGTTVETEGEGPQAGASATGLHLFEVHPLTSVEVVQQSTHPLLHDSRGTVVLSINEIAAPASGAIAIITLETVMPRVGKAPPTWQTFSRPQAQSVPPPRIFDSTPSEVQDLLYRGEGILVRIKKEVPIGVAIQ